MLECFQLPVPLQIFFQLHYPEIIAVITEMVVKHLQEYLEDGFLIGFVAQGTFGIDVEEDGLAIETGRPFHLRVESGILDLGFEEIHRLLALDWFVIRQVGQNL